MIWQSYLIISLFSKTSALMCILAPIAHWEAWWQWHPLNLSSIPRSNNGIIKNFSPILVPLFKGMRLHTSSQNIFGIFSSLPCQASYPQKTSWTNFCQNSMVWSRSYQWHFLVVLKMAHWQNTLPAWSMTRIANKKLSIWPRNDVPMLWWWEEAAHYLGKVWLISCTHICSPLFKSTLDWKG